MSRYRTANLILVGVMPGPKEQNPDEVQRFLRIIVNELLRLWEVGVRIPTPSTPAGRLLRVILVCVCCDKPAAHKMGGFGSHSHTFFCTQCWIEQKHKSSPEAFQQNGKFYKLSFLFYNLLTIYYLLNIGFPKRTNKQQRQRGEDYANLETNGAREAFVKKFATRFSELARFPYFDLVRMIVIDPMHNLLLGE